jgi:hypothetical protein
VTSMGSLVTSQLGREIVADVLDAAAAVLRQQRQMGQQAQDAGRAMLDTGSRSASTAVLVGTEVASGTVCASTEIAAAAANLAQTAAGAMAAAATNAVLNMIPGATTAS